MQISVDWILSVNNSMLFANNDRCLRICVDHIERMHSRVQRSCKVIGTKESVYRRKELNSHRIGLVHQHGRRFMVWNTNITSCAYAPFKTEEWKNGKKRKVKNINTLELRYNEINTSCSAKKCSVSKNLSDNSSFDLRKSFLGPPL